MRNKNQSPLVCTLKFKTQNDETWMNVGKYNLTVGKDS